MFSFFKRQKEKWVQVKTIVYDKITWGEDAGGKIYIHLFESDKGNRRMETACSFSEVSQEKIDKFIKSSTIYQTKLYRWLNGRFDPEIPRYDQIGEEDTVHALKGKVE